MPKRNRRVICVENAGYEVSLQKLKHYVVLNDRAAERVGLLRVKDESGQGYLYPKAMFIPQTSRAENDPRFLRRVETARKSISA